MNRTIAATAGLAIPLLILAGCSGASGDSPSLPSMTGNGAEEASADTNDRGNIAKQLGAEASLTNRAKGEEMATFAVDSITLDKECTADYTQPAENGHYLFVDMRVSTSSAFEPFMGSSIVNPNSFSVIGPDGVSESNLATMGASMCLLEDNGVPAAQNLNPGSSYTPTIVLDTKNDHGTLVLKPGFGSNGNGWEWDF